MGTNTTCKSNDTTESRQLYMALELSQKEWKLGFSVGPGQAGRIRSVAGQASRLGQAGGTRKYQVPCEKHTLK